MTSKSEAEQLAAFMLRNSFATGHGDTFAGLLAELEWQVKEHATQPTQAFGWQYETQGAVDSARKMLAMGIDIQATGEATNNLVAGIIGSLIAHIDEQDLNIKTAIAVGRLAPTQPTHTTTEVSEAMVEALHRELSLRCSHSPGKDAVRYALEAALSPGDGVPGMVLVPREPNEDQLRQLFSMNSALPRTTEEAVAVYRAILNCASLSTASSSGESK